MTEKLKPGLTTILYDNTPLAQLDSPVTLPLGARVQVGDTDYIVNNVRVSIGDIFYDIYYDTHVAEVTGASPSPLD